MEEKRYDWKRFWYPVERDDQIHLSNGVLYDPEGEFGRYVYFGDLNTQPWIRALEDFDDQRCLVLVGERGLGKTDALQQVAARLKASAVAHCYIGSVPALV